MFHSPELNSHAFNQLLAEFADRSTFVSFDIDSVRAAECPGVSCSSPDGFSARDAIEMMYTSGKSEYVKLVDVSEYNPIIEEYRTGRLLAMMFHSFLCGVYERKFGQK